MRKQLTVIACVLLAVLLGGCDNKTSAENGGDTSNDTEVSTSAKTDQTSPPEESLPVSDSGSMDLPSTRKALEDSGNYYNFYQKLAEDGRIIPMMFGYYNVYAHRGVLPDLNPARDNVFYYSMGKTMADALIEDTGE